MDYIPATIRPVQSDVFIHIIRPVYFSELKLVFYLTPCLIFRLRNGHGYQP